MTTMQAEYVDHMGDDLTVVNAARVSFKKHRKSLGPQDLGLLRYLAEHDHFSPFTHPQIQLRLKAPIFVARQAFKSTVGFSPPNEVSRRYVDDMPEFFDPGNWRLRPEGGIKQGSGKGVSASPAVPVYYEEALRACVACYDLMIAHNVAPELARIVLPQSMFTEWYWTGSLAAWFRFCHLRTADDAQEEIRHLATKVSMVIAPLFPNAWTALLRHKNGERR